MSKYIWGGLALVAAIVGFVIYRRRFAVEGAISSGLAADANRSGGGAMFMQTENAHGIGADPTSWPASTPVSAGTVPVGTPGWRAEPRPAPVVASSVSQRVAVAVAAITGGASAAPPVRASSSIMGNVSGAHR